MAVASELTRAAGALGMVGGQVLDLSYTGQGIERTNAFKRLTILQLMKRFWAPFIERKPVL